MYTLNVEINTSSIIALNSHGNRKSLNEQNNVQEAIVLQLPYMYICKLFIYMLQRCYKNLQSNITHL